MATGTDDNILAQFAERARHITRREGLTGIGRRIVGRVRRKPQQIHSYVFKWPLDKIQDMRAAIDATMKPVSPDGEEMDSLLAVWPWATSKDDIRRRLVDRRCYVALHQGQVAAWLWVCDDVHDEEYQRRFEIGAQEVYLRDEFTLPEFRGRNLAPALSTWAARELAQRHGKIAAWSLIDVTNTASLRAAEKTGRRRVGRAGFVERLGIRLHYLVGREAFPHTRRRIYLQRL